MSERQERMEKQLRRDEAVAIRKCADALDALYNRDDAPQLVDGILLYLCATKGFNISAGVTKDYNWLSGNNGDQWYFGTLDPNEASLARIREDAKAKQAKPRDSQGEASE